MHKLFKVGINARPFTQKSMRGLGRHTLELVKELHREDPDLELFLYTYGKVDEYYKMLLPFVHWREVEVSPKIFWDLFILPNQLKKDGIQLFHSTNNLGIPWSNSVKKLLTIHDDLTHRHRMVNKWNNVWGKLNYLIELFLLKKADFFITISESAKRDIIHTMNIPKDKLHVIYNGSNTLIKNQEIEREEYYLYVGGLEERKNIVFMINALEEAQDRIQKNINLVLVSNISSAPAEVLKVVKESSIKILIYENISDEALGDLYLRAKGLINPSLYEGFGLPIIEAMQTGTPVIISKIEVFKEITNEKAYFFDPFIKEELINIVVKIETNEIPVDQYVFIAKKQAEKFLWSTMAKETLTLYRKLLS